ncbi:MAG TPA: Crp/Fnr family transcriptional regulator [Cyclobacteriaceae bacterium]|nr:Crp/Fnr family transcriptional regulator [Cyclobacteriaceae bacterium]
MIPDKILLQYNARITRTQKGQLLFSEGDTATDYFQVKEGQVKMFTLNAEGQEFTQGFFDAGESFGEPALLGNFPYPGSAITVAPARIWRLPKEQFLQLLEENFELHLKLDKTLCHRLQYKAMILTEISSHAPEHRLTTILHYLKAKLDGPESEKIIIPYTRQQLADMMGLRVETVIRTIKKMEQKGLLDLEGRRIKF